MKALHTDLQAAIIAPVIQWLWFVRVDFDEGVAAWSSGYKNFTYLGQEYIPFGSLGSISPIKDTGGVKSAGVNLTVSGIDPDDVALILTTQYLNRKVKIYAAATNSAWDFDPNKVRMVFAGAIDNIDATLGAEASFNISVRGRLSDWERVRRLNYTDADQQKLHPGDKGMEFIAQLSQKKIIFPAAAFLPDPRTNN